MKIMKTTFQQTVKNSLRNIESFDYNSNTDPITVFHPKNSALFNHNATHKTTTKSKSQSQTFESPKPKPHIYTLPQQFQTLAASNRSHSEWRTPRTCITSVLSCTARICAHCFLAARIYKKKERRRGRTIARALRVR